MLFQALSKLKQKSIMTAVMMMALGLILVIWPGQYVPTLMWIVSGVLFICSMVMILNYIDSKKTVANYIKLGGALAVGIAGMLLMIFNVDTLDAISWIFGLLLVIDGVHSLAHTLMYARRAGRKGWWVMIPVSVIILARGVLVIIHPWWKTPDTLIHAAGWMVVGAAAAGILRVILTWPFNKQ